ncbi:metallophosphoesterase [Pimelobacter simplex]|uniref:metallophosphoesterase n=1 Tax=Nocardioides simplex TaxID=2045 RepID=UPI00214FF6EF|nr:metallophosphoesterase [Pimelobacter simplex]UUW90529.1 metallophosphoesterase [Pimelobacter simplex]UUW94359.1 metallophosphoesterase [Pimelobacter simplex]
MGFARGLLRAAGAGGMLGTAVTSYALWEARQYTLRRYDIRTLPAGMRPLRVLHLSDIHMTPGQRRKQEWIRSLAALEPDLVIDSGDNLAHQGAVGPVLDSLGGLLDRPGVFVHGSNDYFEPRLRNPFAYLLPDNGKRHTHVPQLPWKNLTAGLTGAGWLDLTNRRTTLTVGETVLAFAGVDDPHLEYDDLAAVAGPADPDADVRLGIAHAPYLRVLDQFAADGYDAIIAGHTHGGQVCLPWPGGARTLATNCDLDAARARGLHRHPADSRPGDPGSSWLHVSAGIGSNPYLRIRVACRPEATLLTLLPRG